MPHLLFFGSLIKSTSKFQKMNFRSDREGVQITEKNSTDKIYKIAEILKAIFILLDCWPSRTSMIRSLLFLDIHNIKKLLQQLAQW